MSKFKTAPNSAHGAPRVACEEGRQSVRGQGGEMLLMVEYTKYIVTRRRCCGPLSNCSPVAPSAMSFHIGHIVLTHYSKVSLQNNVSLFDRALPQQIRI